MTLEILLASVTMSCYLARVMGKLSFLQPMLGVV